MFLVLHISRAEKCGTQRQGFYTPLMRKKFGTSRSWLTKTLFSVLSPLISSLTLFLSDSFTFLPTASLTLSRRGERGDEIKEGLRTGKYNCVKGQQRRTPLPSGLSHTTKVTVFCGHFSQTPTTEWRSVSICHRRENSTHINETNKPHRLI